MSTQVEVRGMDHLIGPEDKLTPEQNIRLLQAIGMMRAAKAAIQAGMSVAEVEAQEWLVDVDLLDSELV